MYTTCVLQCVVDAYHAVRLVLSVNDCVAFIPFTLASAQLNPCIEQCRPTSLASIRLTTIANNGREPSPPGSGECL